MRFQTTFNCFVCLAIIFLPFSFGYSQNYVLEFNGLNSHVQLDDDIGDGIRSVELWFYVNHDYDFNNTTPRSLFIRNSDNEFGEFGLCLSAFPEYRGNLLFFKREGHDFFYAVSDNTTWEKNTWHHVAGTVHPVEGMKLYIDGVLQQKTDTSTEPTDIRNEVVSIGKWGNLNTRFWEGKIDEVRVWNRALTQQEIQDKMCITLNPEEEVGLKGYWQFNEGEGNIANDISGNFNNGLLISTAYDMEEVCQVNSVDSGNKSSTLFVYPNPASEVLTFEFKGDAKLFRILFYDSLGRLIFDKEGNSEQKQALNVEDFAPGLYIYLVKTERGTISGKVIIE